MFDAFTLRGTSYSSHQPLSFEEMSTDNSAAQGYGLYTKSYDTLGGYLSFYGLRDFGLAYTDHHYAAMLNRYYKTYGFTKYVPNISELELLVESMGRINYGSEIIHNQKGIIGPVSYTIPLKERSDWKIYRLPYDTVPSPLPAVDTASANNPAEYWGTFSLDSTGDTFLDMRDWGKGIVFVNGHNLGRYWNAGPQQTLYVPGCWLKKGTNDIFLVDILNYTKHTTICALRTPILDQLNTKIAGIIARYDSARHATAVSMALTDSLPGEIYYTIDGGGQHPYKEPLYVDRSSRITAWGTRNGVRSEIDSRIAITPTLSFGKEVSTVNPWSDRYSAEGKYTLVDGIGGSGDHHDGTWQGYEGVDLNATVDLGSERAIKEMQLRCLQDNGSWIFLPDTVSYYGSDDGIHFVSIGTLSHQSKREDQKLIKIEPFTLRKELKARYIKVIAKNIGTCPAWHPGAGGKSWLFVDEILIY